MPVLLTGAAGYLGQHLLTHLTAAGHRVTALARSAAQLDAWRDHPQVTPREADLTALAPADWAPLVAGHSACVHAALIWGAPGEELEMRDTAVCARLFDAAGQAGVERAIHLSSTAVHRPFGGVMREVDPLTPTDLYGATKAAGELALWAACGAYGMRGGVLRAGPIVGPPARPGGPLRTPGEIARLVATARSGGPLRVVEGAGRQLVAAEDVARAVCAILAAPPRDQTLLCVDAQPTSWAWVAARIAAATGVEVVIEPAAPGPPARFSTDRLEALGLRFDCREALSRHLAALLA